jgi:hypothetical protein
MVRNGHLPERELVTGVGLIYACCNRKIPRIPRIIDAANFVPKHAFTRYYWWNTEFLWNATHNPLAEGVESFHTTRWTIVMRAAESQVPWGQSALAELCRVYWYPLYTFARRVGVRPRMRKI